MHHNRKHGLQPNQARRSILVLLAVALVSLLTQEHLSFGRAAGEKETTPSTTPGVPNSVPVLTKEDVLSIREGRFFLDGKPFVEISFNKFDLFWQLYDQLTAGQLL